MPIDPSCPVCRTADIVCAKWTLLIVRDLSEGRSRFCELERSLSGISPRTLSLRLRDLEQLGVVERQTFPEVPPRVEYALTDKGRALLPLIEDMRSFGEQWLDGACAQDSRRARPPPPSPDAPGCTSACSADRNVRRAEAFMPAWEAPDPFPRTVPRWMTLDAPD